MSAQVVAYSAHPEDSYLTIMVECLGCQVEFGWSRDLPGASKRLEQLADSHNIEFHGHRRRPMSEQRQRVEAEALEWSQSELWICRDCERGFIAGRTVTAEQVEAAAKAAREQSEWIYSWTTGSRIYAWEHLGETEQDNWRASTRAALTAAGLLIEGGE